ncbi:AraC family transcriptional regulator [Lederbergia panacisoli]|uniref:AraC family transcriptional regulator n=1 Tax=Lederbergia panacisoli TaxID=1255251 RepID=UPI00214CBC78|nr:DNA-binding transcriptional regulator [Lederbergia panacisoli]MCR2822993.1 DNA-binding transcriptional regulator [Lederbergia panacisoli]
MTKVNYFSNFKNRKQVALIIETSNEYARGLLFGIRKYIRENRGWSVYLGEYGRSNTDLTWLLNWEGDGIIARIENEHIADYISKINLPTVDLSAARLLPNLPFVETNDESFAQLAADHLIERGFKYFGFCGNSRYSWSDQRSLHFKEYIQDLGFPCYTFDSYSHQDKFRYVERKEMAHWVKTLPKPIGIMSCFDSQGQQLLEACRIAKVSVPDEVAVIGVDNDELLCELAQPPLSSVIPNSLKTGYQAAFLLDQMMNGKNFENKKYLIEPLGIKTRQSTDVLAINDKVIADALNFIRNHACDGITVQDLLEVTPLSRRIFEDRFRKIVGRTPHEEIISVRLKFVKQLLTETDLPLYEIAERAGFKHTEYLSVVFKRELNMSPSEYRSKSK